MRRMVKVGGRVWRGDARGRGWESGNAFVWKVKVGIGWAWVNFGKGWSEHSAVLPRTRNKAMLAAVAAIRAARKGSR